MNEGRTYYDYKDTITRVLTNLNKWQALLLCNDDEFFRDRTKISALLAIFSFLRDDVADDELSRLSQNEERGLTGSCARWEW